MTQKPAQLLSAAHHTQARRLLRLHTPLGEDRLLAERLEGQESIDGGGFSLLLSAGGAYVKLEGSNIQIHAPGAVTFKAGMHKFVGPGSSSVSAQLPASRLSDCGMQESSAASAGAGSTSR